MTQYGRLPHLGDIIEWKVTPEMKTMQGKVVKIGDAIVLAALPTDIDGPRFEWVPYETIICVWTPRSP